MAITETAGMDTPTAKSSKYVFGTSGDAQNIDVKKARGTILVHSGSVARELENNAIANILVHYDGTGLEVYSSSMPTSSTTKTDSDWFQILDDDDSNPFASSGDTARVSYSNHS